jgi:hypothetical protein
MNLIYISSFCFFMKQSNSTDTLYCITTTSDHSNDKTESGGDNYMLYWGIGY